MGCQFSTLTDNAVTSTIAYAKNKTEFDANQARMLETVDKYITSGDVFTDSSFKPCN